MLDGTIDGYDSYEDTVAGEPSRRRFADRRRRHRHALLVGHDGPAEGRRADLSRVRPLDRDDVAGRRARCSCCSVSPSDSVYLSPAPLYHAAPLRFSMAAQAAGATRRRDGALRRRGVPRRRSSATGSRTPRSCRRCSSACSSCPRTSRDRYDVSSLQCVIHAAAPCPVPVKQQMMDWFGPIIHEYYAGTEGNGFVYASPQGWLGSSGHGRARRSTARSTSSATTARRSPRRDRARSTSRAAPRSSTTTTRTRPASPATRRAGRRSATSATSTTTASSTSPTARRT